MTKESMEIKVKLVPESPEAKEALAAASAYSSAASAAMMKWMQQVTSILCFRSEATMQHKKDLRSALNEYRSIVSSGEIVYKHEGDKSCPNAS